MPTFTGFSPKVISFLKNLSNNNNKEWFDANRSIYEKEIKEPAKLFVSEMADRFAAIGLPFHADPKKAVFRINRDIRFSKDKSPYKTNTGIYFPYNLKQSSKKPVESLGIYLHIDSKEPFIAGGIHCPPNGVLKELRLRVSDDWKDLKKIIESKSFKSEFPSGLVGESLQKAPRGFDSEHPAAEWLKLKEYTVYSKLSFKDIQSEKLSDLLLKKSRVIAPMLDFFNVIFE